MAGKEGETYSSAEGSLVAVIGDEDTCTGFLLAGVGNVDIRKKTNFLCVDSSESALTSAFYGSIYHRLPVI